MYYAGKERKMKKTYVKPVANNVAFAMNENIAASFGSAHLGYSQLAKPDGSRCDEILANYTDLTSGIVGKVEDMSDLMGALFNMYDQIGNDAFEAIMADIRNGSFACWKI
jgi:hypothetical protein